MGLFGKKLTAEQQEELNIATGNLNSLSADCREAYNQFKSSIKELYLICRPTRQMNLVEPAGEENLIQLSKRAADEYLRTVLGAQSRLSAIELPKGIKKKHRKEYEELKSYLEYSVKMLPNIVKSLSPPDALKSWSQDGSAKLNMFVSGVNLLSYVEPPEPVS